MQSKNLIFMIDKWNQFVYYLCEDKKNNVDENKYHKGIEERLEFLGWMKFKEEILHKPNVSIGNDGHIQPDILVQKDGKKQFVIEVKCPSHIQKEKDINQLVSYMRQLKLTTGIYIGEHIEVFYDQPEGDIAVSVLKIPLELDNKRGAKFIELFSKEHFNKDSIVEFCESRIKEMQHEESLNKIKDLLVNDSQEQIMTGMKMYLMEKYGNTFSEEDIVKMLKSLRFSVIPTDGLTDNVTIVSPSKVLQKQNIDTPEATHKHDTTLYSIDGGDFLNKRRFVYQIVKLYVEQHPFASFVELEQVFPPSLQGSYGVIRGIDVIREKGIEEYRYFTKDDELLQSMDGIIFAVSTQWGISNTTKFMNLAKSLGYNITTSNEKKKHTKDSMQKKALIEGQIECILTRNADAKGYFNISDQTLTVLKGSKINPKYLEKVRPEIIEKRNALIAEYAEYKDGKLVVTKDVMFKTPSGAAVFCVGGSSNGWKDWRDMNNNELDIYRKK